MKRALVTTLLVLLALPLVLVGAAAVLLGTEWGRERAVALANGLVPGVRLEGLAGDLPFAPRLARIELVDQGGGWLVVEDARLELDAGSLLRLRPRASLLAASRVTVLRPPLSDPEASADEGGTIDMSLLEGLPAVAVERIELPQIELAPGIATVPVTLAATGRIATGGPGGRAEVSADLRRLDPGVAATASLRATLDPLGDTAELALRADDPGGLVAGLLGRPEIGAARLQLAGSGPLAAWVGRLDGDIDGLGAVALDLGADLREPVRITASGTLIPDAAMLPPAIVRYVADPLRVEATASLPRAGGWSVERLHAATGGLSLDATASAAPGEPPRASVMFQAVELTLDPAALAGVNVQLTAVPQGSERWTLTAEGAAERADVPGVDLGAVGPWRLDAAGEAGTAGPLELRRLTLTNAIAGLTGNGRYVPATGEAATSLQLSVTDLAELHRLALPAGLPAAGSATLDVRASRTDAATPLSLNATLDVRDLHGLPATVADLIGPMPSARLTGRLEPAGTLTIASATVAAATASVTATGAVDLAAGSLELAWQGSVPDLAPFSDLATVRLVGGVTVEGTASGRIDALRLAAAATAARLGVGPREFSEVALRVDDAVLQPELMARLSARAAQGGVPLDLGATARLDGETLVVEELALAGPGVTGSGAARVDLASGLATAEWRGTVADLRRLAAWHGLDLAGQADLALTAAPADAGQSATVELSARDLRQADLRVATANLRATLTDALGAPRVDARLVAANATAGAARVDQLTVTARGPLQATAIGLDASGDVAGPARVELQGLLDVSPAAIGLRVETLDATLRGVRATQRGPARVRLAGGGWSVEDLDLAIGQGRLAGGLAATPGGAARGELRLSALPLGTAESFGAPPLGGTLDGSLTVSGRAAAPTLTARLTARDVIYAGPAGEGVPPADLVLEVTSSGTRVDASTRLEGLSARPVVATAQLPVRIGLAPFAFLIDRTGSLVGSLVVDAELERITPRHLLDERRVAGRLAGELRLAGTLLEPRVAGDLEVADGRYDDAVTGTTLRGIDLRVTGRDGELVLERLAATDGAGGRLEGSGRARIGGDASVAWQAVLEAASLRAVRADLADAVVSGRLQASGDLTRADIRGTVTVEDAEIRVPEQLGGSIPVIEVSDGTEPAAPPAPQPTPAERSTLDLTVDAPGRVFVRGRGLDSEWRAQLAIRGSLAQPRIEGPVTLVRGRFELLGRSFDLARGEIRFQGASPPDPALDIRAEARAQEITAIVAIAGRASRPSLTLSSEPALPEDEVLSRLLFGRDATRISAAQAVQIAAALRELAGDGGPGLLDALGKLRDTIGLDTLDFGTEEGEAGVRAGRYLSDQVYLQVERGVEPGSGRATVEIELTPNVRVQSEVTDRATTGVGLEWRFDY